MENYLVLPNAKDIRAARAFLNWKQADLAYKCNVTVSTIIAIENEKSKPSKELLDKITEIFADEGVKFNSNGGFNIDKDFLKVFEGLEGYVRIQDDIIKTCGDSNSEVLFLGVEDKKSAQLIIDKEKEIYKAGINCRYLMSKNDDYILGPLSEYKKIDPSYFFSNNVVLIYSTKIVITSIISDNDEFRSVCINDKGIAAQMRGYFNNLWDKGEQPSKSSVKQILFRDK